MEQYALVCSAEVWFDQVHLGAEAISYGGVSSALPCSTAGSYTYACSGLVPFAKEAIRYSALRWGELRQASTMVRKNAWVSFVLVLSGVVVVR